MKRPIKIVSALLVLAGVLVGCYFLIQSVMYRSYRNAAIECAKEHLSDNNIEVYRIRTVYPHPGGSTNIFGVPRLWHILVATQERSDKNTVALIDGKELRIGEGVEMLMGLQISSILSEDGEWEIFRVVQNDSALDDN